MVARAQGSGVQRTRWTGHAMHWVRRARAGQCEQPRIKEDRASCMCEASCPYARALRQGKVRVQGENKSTNGDRLRGHPKTRVRPDVQALALPMMDVSSLAHFL